MKPVLTAQQMRETENRYFETGVSSNELMQTAAREFELGLEKVLSPEGTTCVFACGKGGNGGDGYAAALLFQQRGGRAVILCAEKPTRGDALEKYNAAKDKVFACVGPEALEHLPRPTLWADCLFGIGLNKEPTGVYKAMTERMNADREKGSFVISCDIPSGLNADTGETYGTHVQADATITFHAVKRGHLLGQGPDLCGKLFVRSIGIPMELTAQDCMLLVEDADVCSVLPARLRTAHKNTFGHVLVVAGSRGMAGAAIMCASAALATGAGLVTVACPESLLPILQISVPCAMCIPLKEENGALAEAACPALETALKGKSAVAIGPGLSLGASPKCIETVLKSRIPTVLDADALNILSKNETLKQLLHPLCALTPHPGEAGRLIGMKSNDAVETAKMLRALGASVLVKGASTVICGERLHISTSGTNAMAKGGSGDVLTGMTAALLARGMNPEQALWAASQLHGRAGEEAERQFGNVSMLPTDLIRCIGKVYPNENA